MPSRTAVVPLLVAVLMVAACTGSDDAPAEPTNVATTTADGLSGPLCPVLPKDDEPGNPMFLRDLNHAEALTWIPIATVVEGLSRAADGLDLAGRTDVTLLVPSDDTMTEVFNVATLDALTFTRTHETAALLRAHVVPGSLSLADLAAAGQVVTEAGTTITVTGPADAPALDGAEVLCGDYVTTGGRIHLIGAVLGPLPDMELDDDSH